jgi:hypothetical protein
MLIDRGGMGDEGRRVYLLHICCVFIHDASACLGPRRPRFLGHGLRGLGGVVIIRLVDVD